MTGQEQRGACDDARPENHPEPTQDLEKIRAAWRDLLAGSAHEGDDEHEEEPFPRADEIRRAYAGLREILRSREEAMQRLGALATREKGVYPLLLEKHCRDVGRTFAQCVLASRDAVMVVMPFATGALKGHETEYVCSDSPSAVHAVLRRVDDFGEGLHTIIPHVSYTSDIQGFLDEFSEDPPVAAMLRAVEAEERILLSRYSDSDLKPSLMKHALMLRAEGGARDEVAQIVYNSVRTIQRWEDKALAEGREKRPPRRPTRSALDRAGRREPIAPE